MPTKYLENRGLLMSRTRKGGVLNVPIKDKAPMKFFTSLSGLKDFVEGRRNFVYFNPIEDVPDS